MYQHTISQILSNLHQAFNTDEPDKIQACYTESAKVVVKPNQQDNKQDVYQALNAFRKQYAPEQIVSQGDEVVIQADDVALVISKLYLADKQDKAALPCDPHKAIYVLKRDKQGQWRCAIDNFFGTDLLNYI